MSSSAPPPPLKFSGCAQFRQRIVFATLSGRRVRIDNIRDKDEEPGLRDFEANFLRLIEQLTNGCRVEINETGTSLKYSPGLIIGGSVEHDCGTGRSIGWFIEGLLPMLPFAKKPTNLVLTGITNDDTDYSIDMLKTIHLPTLLHFGISEGLKLELKKRGAPPKGGGLVLFSCPVVREMKPIHLLDEGYIKRVRGVAYTAKVSPQVGNRMVDGARGLLNNFIPDVYIYTDHYKGPDSGLSPGYGLSLVASSTSGCIYGAQRATGTAAGLKRVTDAPGGGPADSRTEVPEDVGRSAASLLLDEIARGGCIDTNVQSLVFTLMALGPEDVSRVRLGQLGPAGIATLRLLRQFFGVVLKLKPDVQEQSAQSAAAAASSSKLAGKKRERSGDDDDDDDDDEEAEADFGDDAEGGSGAGGGRGGSGSGGRQSKRRRGKDGGAIDASQLLLQPLTLEPTGGHSGKTIVASCLGLGYKNFAKKVT